MKPEASLLFPKQLDIDPYSEADLSSPFPHMPIL